MSWLDRFPLWLLFAGAVLMGFAPTIVGIVLMPLSWLISGDLFGFIMEPPLWSTLEDLFMGRFTRPQDVLNLVWISALPVLLVIRLVRDARRRIAN